MSKPPSYTPFVGARPPGYSVRPMPSNALPMSMSPQHMRVPVSPAMPKGSPMSPGPNKPASGPPNSGVETVPSIPAFVSHTQSSRHLDKDMTLPPDLNLPEAEAYARSLEMEAKLDYYLQKAQLRLQSACARPERRAQTSHRVLRFTVSNSHENQPFVDGKPVPYPLDSSKEPSWSVRLSGRLLDVHGNIVTGSGTKKMSSFFKTIMVQLDRVEFPNQWNITWNRSPSADDVDTFTFTHKSKQESIVNIYLFPATHSSHPENFSPAPALRQALDLTLPHYTRQSLLMAFWRYIRENSLQDPTKKSRVRCNAALKGLFDLDSFEYDELPVLMQNYMLSGDPIHIAYQIRFFKDNKDAEVVLDIPVEVDLPTLPHLSLNSHSTKIAEWNKFSLEHLDRIHSKKRKRDFYSDFASDPLHFMSEMLHSQQRDHAIISKPPQNSHRLNNSTSNASSSSSNTAENVIDKTSTSHFNQLITLDAVHNFASTLPQRIPQDVPFVDTAPVEPVLAQPKAPL